jgi:cytochrome c oxidase cbb3-type subunit 1
MQSNTVLEYDYSVAKLFTYTTILFGFLGMLVGTIIALQMAFPGLNELLGEYSTFGRLRPIHTNTVIFGFTVSGIFATWYYVGQRVLKVSMAESKFLMIIGKVHFWIYFIAALLATISLLFGISGGKEYAQYEWPFDLAVVVLWVLWGVSMMGLIGIRREKALYISIWYYLAAFLGIAMLYLFNNMTIPTYFATDGLGSFFHSVSMYAGTNDALVQWWYGHNAVAFGFTVPIVGIIYYFLPKESGQAIFSYKFSLL